MTKAHVYVTNSNHMRILLSLIFFLHVGLALSQVPNRNLQRGSGMGDEIMVDEAPYSGSKNKSTSYYQLNGKYGFILPGNLKQEAIYDGIRSGTGFFIVKKGTQFGLTDNMGVVLGKIAYDSIFVLNDNSIVVKQKGLYGSVDNKGNVLLTPKYHQVLFSSDAIPFSWIKNEKDEMKKVWHQGEKIENEVYTLVDIYGNAVIAKTNGKYALLGKESSSAFEFDSVYAPVQDYLAGRNQAQKNSVPIPFNVRNIHKHPRCFVVLKSGKYGLYHANGSVIYPAEYDAVSNMETFGYYTVKQNKLYGIYFLNSGKTTGIEYDRVSKDGIGYVMAVKNKKAGVFNLLGELIIPFEYDDDFIAQYTGLGLRVTKNKKRGLIDPTGKIIIEPVFDGINTFYEHGFRHFIKVDSNGKHGVVHTNGQTIIPVQFEWVGEINGMFKVVTLAPDRKFGLYDTTGKVILPPTLQWITKSDMEVSEVLILKHHEHSYNFMDEKHNLVLTENIDSFGYVHDEEWLLFPHSSNNYLMLLKNKKGKYGLLNERTGKLTVPMVYDQIRQKFDADGKVFFAVRVGKKFGLIDDKNKVIIPIIYDDLRLDFVWTDGEKDVLMVAAKNGLYGLINMRQQVQIPFMYKDLQCVSRVGLYKAKTGKHYTLINAQNKVLNPGPWDEIGNFEIKNSNPYDEEYTKEALGFYQGKMRLIDGNGKIVSVEKTMNPHKGFKTFDELKSALVVALDSYNDQLLMDFAEQIAPSEHLLYFIKSNVFNNQKLNGVNPKVVSQVYYEQLKEFRDRYWNDNSSMKYNRESIIGVVDYTWYDENIVTNIRSTDHAYGDRFMERLLRKAVKVNGYWISTYFMSSSF